MSANPDDYIKESACDSSLLLLVLLDLPSQALHHSRQRLHSGSNTVVNLCPEPMSVE